jgi:hypothetical protein|tara:strand:- start:126 stop:557 length:432 start_codon:yes stop_codon:yes gene_type:complete
MAKRKKTTIAQEVDKAAKLLQRLVRLKASDENGYCQCVTCGKIDHYKSMQGGHFYSRRHLVFKLFEENLHPQCAGCNLYGMRTTKIQEAYRIYMEDIHGARRIRAMQRLAWRASPKFDRKEVIQFAQQLKEQIKEQESRIGEI